MGPSCVWTNPSMSVSFMFGGRMGANPETNADCTPGRFFSRSSSCVQKPVILALSVYVPLGRETRMVMTFSAWRPVWTSCSFQKARSISPQPISRTRAIASSPATRMRRKICAPAADVVLPAVSFNDPEIPLTSRGASGASPKSTPVSKLVPRVKSITRQSMEISSARGMPPALVS